MAAKPPLAADEVRRILLWLAPLTADRAVALVGGQAIALWTTYLGVGEASPARDPLASRDIDLEGSARGPWSSCSPRRQHRRRHLACRFSAALPAGLTALTASETY